jgi:hypothetical protein
MPRIRTIKPEFPQSQSMGRVSRDARLLFIELWTICDDSGRTRAASRMLASLLFPYDDDAPRLIDGWLGELESEGCVVRYRVHGDDYLQVCNWLNHQKIDKPSASKIPPFDESSRILASPREHSSLDQGPRTKDQGPGIEDQGPGSRTVAPSALPPTSPQKARRGQRPKGEPAPTSEAWTAYAEAFTGRYGVEPIRNATVNGQLSQFVGRVPAADAPHVARFYVGLNRGLYVSARHTVALLLRDCEGLHADWRRGQTVTDHEARALDLTQTNANAFEPLLRAAREREALPESHTDAIPLLPTG